jgi:hypothetical protein
LGLGLGLVHAYFIQCIRNHHIRLTKLPKISYNK